jgi:hypothetical protein
MGLFITVLSWPNSICAALVHFLVYVPCHCLQHLSNELPFSPQFRVGERFHSLSLLINTVTTHSLSPLMPPRSLVTTHCHHYHHSLSPLAPLATGIAPLSGLLSWLLSHAMMSPPILKDHKWSGNLVTDTRKADMLPAHTLTLLPWEVKSMWRKT